MKDLACFPYRWKFLALALLVASIVLFVVNNNGYEIPWLTYPLHDRAGDLMNNNLTDEVWLSGLLGSLLLLCFCRERTEDEYVRELRLHCWQWAILVNYSLFLLAVWTVYGLFHFLGVILYNVLTPLIIYLLLFYTRLHLLPRLSQKSLAR